MIRRKQTNQRAMRIACDERGWRSQGRSEQLQQPASSWAGKRLTLNDFGSNLGRAVITENCSKNTAGEWKFARKQT